jgi:eukaryotic-like serine/threonine-protein kinase
LRSLAIEPCPGSRAALHYYQLPLDSGIRLGPYEVVAPIGAGAMGEVYRARDARLGRDVALKVLPLGHPPERVERFSREARAAAALAHPNVLVVHDVGSDSGVVFLVAELLVGQTLRERLDREGRLPAREAVTIGVQVLRGLAAAHARGIIHRDIKPDNLFLTDDGQVKILDFGVARLTDEVVLGATLTGTLTSAGAAVGTAAYMSPEQARGQTVDARSDLWSFGVVLYELLSGRQPFRGDTTADTITAILTREPPELGTEGEVVPASVERVIRHCLAKQPEERFQSASDVAFALENAGTWSSGADSAPAPTRSLSRAALNRAGRGLIFAAVAGLAGTAAWLALAPPAAERRVVRSTLLAPEGTELDFSEGAPALSPDGRRLAVLARRPDGTRQIWLRSLDSSTAQALAGTEGATHPFWSPDGAELGFFSDRRLRRLDLGSGVIRALCAVEPTARGGAWGPDGTILFAPSGRSVLFAIAAQGGAAVAATQLDGQRHETFHRFPHFLPDGQRFMFLSDGTDEPEVARSVRSGTLFVAGLGTRQRTYVAASDTNALVSPTGHLLLLRGDTLLAQPFDAARAALAGSPVELASRVESSVRNEAAMSVAADGTLVFQQGLGSLTQLAWMNRDGRLLETIGPPGRAGEGVELSRDGRRVALTLWDETTNRDIWVRDLERDTATRISSNAGHEVMPIWSPDERRVLYGLESDREAAIVASSADGAGRAQILYHAPVGQVAVPTSMVADSLVAIMIQGDDGFDIALLRLPEGAAEPFGKEEFDELLPQLAPGGEWLAYQSNESGRPEIYVQRLSGDQRRFQISSAGGTHPRWRRDGRELFFLSPDLMLFAVDLTLGPRFAAGPPRLLFEPKVRPTFGYQYAVAADGERFLVIRTVRDQGEPPLIMVQNWAAEIGRR